MGNYRMLVFLFCCMVCIIISHRAYSVQYYDPKSGRYIIINDESAKIRNARLQIRNNNPQVQTIPSPREIEAAKIQRIQEEQERSNNNEGQAYRKFDPQSLPQNRRNQLFLI